MCALTNESLLLIGLHKLSLLFFKIIMNDKMLTITS